MNFESTREQYGDLGLSESMLAALPHAQLRDWIDAAFAAGEAEAHAMCVATVDESGIPSSRFVLLRGLDAAGLRFFTSYSSRKGSEIAKNPHVALAFYWKALHRQVRIEGTAAPLSDEESDAYFASRPRGHQLGAWASEQSQPIAQRETLEERVAHFDERFEGEEVPRPHSWGGYLVSPRRYEFWQGRTNRVHDRLVYVRDGRAWRIERLQP